MNWLVPLTMFGWIPLILVLFALLPGRRAAITGFLIGWLFLPMVSYPILGFPDYTKPSAICVGVLLGVAIFDFHRLAALRPRWMDVPVLWFIISPFVSSVGNSLGVHEGLSVVFAQAVPWGVPYVIGRVYFDSLAGMRELAIGIFLGGLTYVPLCLFEVWKGPQLHRLLYGYEQGGSLRPMVFMDNSLMLSFWMTAASVIGIWLWKTRALSSFRGIPMIWMVLVLVVTAICLKSANAWILLTTGVVLFLLSSVLRTRAFVVLLLVLTSLYVTVRATGLWSGDQAVTVASTLINQPKADSLAYRLVNEKIIAGNARERPILGWGRQLRAFYNKQSQTLAVPDSFWIITFVQFGLAGLLGLGVLLILPVARFLKQYPAEAWNDPSVAPAAALAMVLALYITDHLANAMINPIFMLAAGALSGHSRQYSKESS